MYHLPKYIVHPWKSSKLVPFLQCQEIDKWIIRCMNQIENETRHLFLFGSSVHVGTSWQMPRYAVFMLLLRI